MHKYKKFNVEEIVILNEEVICQSDYKDREHFDRGTKFKIKSFPPCSVPDMHGKYFVYGKTLEGITVRCWINQIDKIK